MSLNREDLKAFVDGELTSAHAEAMRQKIENNGTLAQEVAFLKLIGQGVRECAVEIPVSGVAETLDRVRRRRTRWILELVAACGIVLIISFILFPVFAQSKNAAKGTAERQMRNLRIAREMGMANSAGGQAVASDKDVATPSVGNLNRMVVQNADLDEVVRDVSAAESETRDYVKVLGGFVQSSSLNTFQLDAPKAELNVRVPARMFAMAMDHFKSLAIDSSHIKSVNVSGQDVTTQYADATARLKVMAAEEDSYVTMLKGARRLGEIMSIKDRLATLREQIESLKAQSEALKNESDLASISLTFEQEPKINGPEPSTSWSADSWTSAINGLQATFQFIATLLIFLFVYSPIWLPLGLIGVWIYRRRR